MDPYNPAPAPSGGAALPLAILNTLDKKYQELSLLEEAVWALAKATIGEAVLPSGRAVRADEMCRYLSNRLSQIKPAPDVRKVKAPSTWPTNDF